jgi:hypothetical protein
MGALSAWIYNIAAKKLGGIEIEMRDSIAGFTSCTEAPLMSEGQVI